MGTSIFTDPGAYADEASWHAEAARLRAPGGLVRVTEPGFMPLWAAVRHADVAAIGRDGARFHNAPHPILVEGPNREGAGPPVRNLVGMDGDEHRAYRAIVANWFTPGSLRQRVSDIEALVDRVLDGLAARSGEVVDFAHDVASALPLRVLLGSMGIDEADDAHIHRLSRELFGAKDDEVARGDNDATIAAVVAEFGAYFMGLAMQRRAEPGDDLASVIANARVDGELLPPDLLVPYFVLMAAAGHDTVSTVLAGAMEALARHPDQLRQLQADPGMLPGALDELLRWVTPTKHFMRTAVTDVEVSGQVVRAGEWVLLSYASANRDEAVFADPFRLDLSRSNAADHLAFGVGPHYCVGAHLARLELRTFFERLLPRLDGLEVAGPVRLAKTTFVGTYKQLPLRIRLR